MHLIHLALRRPLTVMVLILAIALGSFLAVGGSASEQLGLSYPEGLPRGMEVDIFPSLNLPVIYVCQPYGGMDPAQMEGYLTNYYEYHFLYISGIHHVECGILITLGLLTRAAVIPTIMIMLVAVATTKLPILSHEGFWKMAHDARTDYAMLLGSIFVWIVGAGRWSLDCLLTRPRQSP